MPRQPAHRWAVHPRWRGEQPLYGSNGEKTSGSSPLARGTADDEQRRLMWGRFIPAGAGNRPSRRRVSRSASVHPRWRGEQIVLLNRQIDERGSSPLARGTVMTTPAHRHRRRFIPAGAGNSVVQCRCRRCHAVHPRWRGEQRFALKPSWRVSRFIPAGAGNSHGRTRQLAQLAVHPRWRGEQP